MLRRRKELKLGLLRNVRRRFQYLKSIDAANNLTYNGSVRIHVRSEKGFASKMNRSNPFCQLDLFPQAG